MGDPVLEGDAEEFVFMPPLECFREEARDPCYHSAFAGPRRPVADAQERSICCAASRIAFLQCEAFPFETKLLEHALRHSIEDCELL